MVFFNYATKQLAAKIVYYGPGLSGKTTNLQVIYRKTHPKSRGELISLETGADRTLFFDLLPLEVGRIKGFRVRFQLYTVPGQVHYNETRKLVLKGVDGIIFVADSQEAVLNSNLESMENLRENLSFYNLKLEDLPLVIQYNKRDLANILPVAMLEKHLNDLGVPHFEAIAVRGVGVFETLKGISKLTLARIAKKLEEQEEGKKKYVAVESRTKEGKEEEEEEESTVIIPPERARQFAKMKEETEGEKEEETEVVEEKSETETVEKTAVETAEENVPPADQQTPQPTERQTIEVQGKETRKRTKPGEEEVEVVFDVEKEEEKKETEKVYFRRISVSKDEADKQLDALVQSILGEAKAPRKKVGELERKPLDEVFKEVIKHEKTIKKEEQFDIPLSELEASNYISIEIKPEKGKKLHLEIPVKERGFDIVTLKLTIKLLGK